MDNKRLRILSIIPYKILPARLGGEKGIAVFNEYLAREVELVAISTKDNDASLAKGYTFLNILGQSKARYGDISLFSRLKKYINKIEATHLITEHPYYGWLAAMLRRATGVVWIVHSHNIEYMRSKSIGRWWWKALKKYEGWAYNSADRVFFISEDDKKFAVEQLGVKEYKSQVVTYGIEISSIPSDLEESRRLVCEKHNIGHEEKILLFNGALYHSTNYDALKVILDQINPVLLNKKDFKYKIIVCGKGLPAFFNELKGYAEKNIIYAGFVDDVSIYFKAADIFLNPILSGGGVKTKAIEAIAMNCTVVSSQLGAMGIKREVCGNKLSVVPENAWDVFSELVINAAATQSETPKEFYQHYFWGNIISNVVKSLG